MKRKIAEILGAFEAFPVTDIATLLQGKRPLIIAPHPDDESLGCGGLIAAACAAGTAPAVIILTDGAASHPGSEIWPPAKLAGLREQEALQAARLLGLADADVTFFRQPDGALAGQGDSFDALVERAAALGRRLGCGLVIGPWGGDPHCDHEAGALLAAAVADRTGWEMLSYPVWGWLRDGDSEFDEPRQNGWRLDISAHSLAKQCAIAAHASQYGEIITDCPQGFRLPQDLLKIFSRPYEVFVA